MTSNNISTLAHSSVLGHSIVAELKLIDLSSNGNLAHTNAENWYNYLSELPTSQSEHIHYGGYLEERFFYSNEELFGKGETRRNIHLGVDVWLSEDTPIFAPLDGIVQSIKYNKYELDYGHTVILRHEENGLIFYSLYGHLSSFHVDTLKANMIVPQGESFCTIGSHSENGGWPPHLHFQLIMDLEGNIGDYPGVASAEKLEFYMKNCPDPTPFIFSE